MEFLPSEVSLQRKLSDMRSHYWMGPQTALAEVVASVSTTLDSIIPIAFPSTRLGEAPMIHVVGSEVGDVGFTQQPLEHGMYVIYETTAGTAVSSATLCPIRLGRITRVVRETGSAYAVMQSMWPILKPSKHGGRLNLFGTWLSCPTPVNVEEPKAKKVASKTCPHLIIEVCHIRVWPIDVEKGADGFDDGVRIHFAAFHYLRSSCAVDLCKPEFTFSKRGKEFYMAIFGSMVEHFHAGKR